MMQKNKAIKAGIGYTVGNYLLKGLSFLTIPLFSRLLAVGDYGKYNTFLAYESILFVLIGCAIHSSYNNARYKYGLVSEGTEKGYDYDTYVSVTMVFVIVSTLIWLFVVNLFGPFFEGMLGLSRPVLNLLILFSFGNAIITCFNTDASIAYAYKEFLMISAVNAVSNIVISVALILTVFDLQRYMGRVIGTVVPVIFISIYIIFRFFHRARPEHYRYFLKWGIRYSLPVVPHGLGQIILNQFDRIMITRMVSDAATGIYSFAYNIYSIVQVTFTSLGNVWQPWFYQQMEAGNYQGIKKYSSLYIEAMAWICASVILVSPELIAFLGTAAYHDAVYSAIPIVAGGFFAFLYTIPSMVEYYHEKTNWIAVGTCGAALLNIVLNYIFILKSGYIAAAYTTLATYILYFVFHFLIAYRIEKRNLFSMKAIVLSSLGVLLAALFARWTLQAWVIRWGIVLITAVIGLALEEKQFGLIRKRSVS